MQARRAERDLRQEKEKALRLERELEGWKGLRVERGLLFNGDGSRRGSESGGGNGSRRVSLAGSVRRGVTIGEGGTGGGVARQVSNSKGFL